MPLLTPVADKAKPYGDDDEDAEPQKRQEDEDRERQSGTE